MSEPTIRHALPAWSEPGDLQQAATIITKLGRNMHEHAYLVGRTLLWVKKEVGHGKFLKWLEGNVWFGQPTAYHMMRFANACIKQGQLSEYHGHRTKLLPGNNLPTPMRKSTKRPESDEPLSDEPGLVPPSDPAEDDPLPPEEAEPAGLERFDFIEPPIDPEGEDEPLTGELLYQDVERMVRRGFSRLPISEQSEFIQRIVTLVNDIEVELGL